MVSSFTGNDSLSSFQPRETDMNIYRLVGWLEQTSISSQNPLHHGEVKSPYMWQGTTTGHEVTASLLQIRDIKALKAAAPRLNTTGFLPPSTVLQGDSDTLVNTVTNITNPSQTCRDSTQILFSTEGGTVNRCCIHLAKG